MQPNDEGHEVTLVGEIAHMISLPTERSGQEADHIPSSVKVVARARSHRELTLPAVAI